MSSHLDAAQRVDVVGADATQLRDRGKDLVSSLKRIQASHAHRNIDREQQANDRAYGLDPGGPVGSLRHSSLIESGLGA